MCSQSFFAAGVLVLGLLLSPAAKAQTPSSYLRIQTADGKSLKTLVRINRGIDQAFLHPPGRMTFILDAGVNPDFLFWALGHDGFDHSTSGTFQWFDPHGRATETFRMRGVHLVSYLQSAPKTTGGTLILTADYIEVFPPFKSAP